MLIGYYEGQEAEKRAKIESAKYKAELEAEGAKARAEMAAEDAKLAEWVEQFGTIADQVHMEEFDRLTPEQRARLDELLGDDRKALAYLEQLEREGAFAPRKRWR